MEEMIVCLECVVQVQLDFVQGWYFFGCIYMIQECGVDVVWVFECVVEFSGWQLEVFGQWVQVLYFFGGKKMIVQIKVLVDEVLKGDLVEVIIFGLFGIVVFEEQCYVDVIGFWECLVLVLLNEDLVCLVIQGGIQCVCECMIEVGQILLVLVVFVVVGVILMVKVDISDVVKGQVKVDDSVFVFVCVVGGLLMLLVVKCLIVVDLLVEVSLSDVDVMMLQFKFSGFLQVELVVWVFCVGNVIFGEWIGCGKLLFIVQLLV